MGVARGFGVSGEVMDSDEVLTLSHQKSGEGSPLFRVESSRHRDLKFAMMSQYSSQSVDARYTDFSLVSPFMQLLLHRRPKALHLDYLCTETADLARFALSLDIRVVVSSGLESVVLGESEADHRWGSALLDVLNASKGSSPPKLADDSSFGYEHYALSSRNHALLIKWVDRVAQWFADRQKILDVGCGTGVFLDQMTRRGLHAEGVDSNVASIRYAKSLGLNARCVDVREGLSALDCEYDAIHCSHLVEHMTAAELSACMAVLYRILRPGGRVVFVFPDPESIRSQLLGFWRDPTHVRFYHPDIVESMARAAGLLLEHSSQKEDSRSVVQFSYEPPEFEQYNPDPDLQRDEIDSDVLRKLRALEHRVTVQERWIRQLWAVNQTWAWADDAVLSFKKPQDC